MSPAISRQSATASEGRCAGCIHFCNDPAALEGVFANLTAMSSGYASVKAHDGLCQLHGWYLSCRDTCPDFSERSHQT